MIPHLGNVNNNVSKDFFSNIVPDRSNPNSIIGNLDPKFVILKRPETYLNHIGEITQNKEPIRADEILRQLLGQIKKLDFQTIVFPEVRDIQKQIAEVEDQMCATRNQKTDKELLLNLRRKLSLCKLAEKHYLVESIIYLLQLAEKNKWGFCMNHNFNYK